VTICLGAGATSVSATATGDKRPLGVAPAGLAPGGRKDEAAALGNVGGGTWEFDPHTQVSLRVARKHSICLCTPAHPHSSTLLSPLALSQSHLCHPLTLHPCHPTSRPLFLPLLHAILTRTHISLRSCDGPSPPSSAPNGPQRSPAHGRRRSASPFPTQHSTWVSRYSTRRSPASEWTSSG
jgi:hypothetical protein